MGQQTTQSFSAVEQLRIEMAGDLVRTDPRRTGPEGPSREEYLEQGRKMAAEAIKTEQGLRKSRKEKKATNEEVAMGLVCRIQSERNRKQG